MTTIHNVSGVSRSCMLVQLNISAFTGRRRDNGTTKEVNAAKNAQSSRAASVNKNLFADCAELDAINKHAAKCRQLHYQYTMPWDDGGQRLLPVTAMLKYKQEMRDQEEEFDRLVRRFCDRYDTLVAAMGFRLGDLFDRMEYPTAAQVKKKFKWSVVYLPVPTAGDFRLDIEADVQREIAEQLEQSLVTRVNASVSDVYDRLYKMMAHLSERMDTEGDDKVKRFRNNMVEQALDTLDSLKYLNPLGDQKLESVRTQLVGVLRGTDVAALRDRVEHREAIKSQVDALMEQLDWSIDDDTDETNETEQAQ